MEKKQSLKGNGTDVAEPKRVLKRKPAVTKARSNGKYSLASETGVMIDAGLLLNILTEVKNGNFAVRMPAQIGINGKISDTLNEIIDLNEKMMDEFTKAGKIIGKQGKLTERIPLPNGKGAWHKGVDSLNTLISDLVHPTIEIAHVIGSVANGNLSEEMPLNIGGHLLKGEFLSIAREVNYMVKQLPRSNACGARSGF
jgi:HAMP domain-containing protein